jgi:transketolase
MDKINELRRDILQSSFDAGACHIGSALSCLGILVDLFYNQLTQDDIFIFSKASGVSAYYSILADKGYFPKEKLSFYLKNYPLPSKEVPGVLHSVGSLGHGLPIAVGLAYVNPNKRVFVLISDGEVEEGTFWESLLFKRQHKLENLKIIVDWNGCQAIGRIEDVLDLPWDFIKSMGVDVVKTIKGAGVSFLKDRIESHYINLTPELLERALKENE